MGVRVVAMATKFGPKIALISSLKEIWTFIACTIGDFGAVEFQYAIRIFKGAKGVAMATKFEQKKPKLH